ncbi:hypothetical protein RDABS01_030528 [Bienertia sinuspersici]
MGESKVMVYGVVSFLCIAAAALAFAAEATKIKESDVIVTDTTCIYPNTAADVLGYVAAVLLLIAEITISAVTRCACCQRNSSNSQSVGAIITFVISWVASAIGIALLLAAANLSTTQEYYSESGLTGHCYLLRTGIFSCGGGLALIAGILGLFAYHCSTKRNQQQPAAAAAAATAMPYNYNQGGIAMGHPQFDAASTNPYPKQQQYV